MRTIKTRLIAAAIALPTLSGLALVATPAASAAPVAAAPVAAGINDLQDEVSGLEDNVAKLQKKANKADKRLGTANTELKKAEKSLAKAEKGRKKAGKRLNRVETDGDDARTDLGMARYGANVARSLEARAEQAQAESGDDALIAVMRTENRVSIEPALLNLSLDATVTERTATVEAIQADWAAAGARFSVRNAMQAVDRAEDRVEEATTAQQEAKKAAKKAGKKLGKAEDKLGKAEKKLKKAKEKKAAEERRKAAEKAARQAAARDFSMPGTGHTTSPYGMRTHPITGVHKLHSGTDFSYGDGKARAAKSGKVASVVWNNAYGNLVTISHGNGLQSRYAHLASPSVSGGQRVDAGEIVGQIGSTGYSTGPHLHFEVLRNGDFVNADTWLANQ